MTSCFFSTLQAPEAPTPLKAMLQRLNFSPFSAISPPQIKGSPRNLASKLFSLRKSGSFTLSASPGSVESTPESGQEGGPQTSDLKPKLDLHSILEEKDAGQMEDSEKKSIMDSKRANGASRDVEDLNNEVNLAADDELLYEAESPDEAALVHAAHAYRCTLRGRSTDHLLVDLPGIGSLAVQLLHILPFDSNRKRMSVVVRHPLSGQVVVYTKGADSVIMDLSETPTGKFE